MADTFFIEGLNTLPEQVQLNKEDIETLKTKIDTNTNSIDSIKQLYLLKTDASNTYATKTELSSYLSIADASNTYLTKSYASSNYLTIHDAFNIYLKKTDASNTYLTKTDASSTYATINALKPLQNSYFDADLTPAGLAKIQANATIGTSITLDKDTDFIESITNTDLAHRTVIFSLYRDDDEEVYISENIKLNIVNTTDYYSDNDQPHIWFTGLGVIKLGSASASNNNYLCYIAYDTTSTSGLMITPVQKLN